MNPTLDTSQIPLLTSCLSQVFNEPQGCHGLNPQTYNQQVSPTILLSLCPTSPPPQYDAVVTEIRRVADPQHR